MGRVFSFFIIALILLIVVFVLIAAQFQLGIQFYWPWVVLSVLVLIGLILFLFGSEKLRNSMTPQRIKEVGRRDQIVILFGYLVQIIILFVMVSPVPIWVAIVCAVFTAFLPPLIEFIFGSQKLRDETIPKWLKDSIQKRQESEGKK